MLHLFYKTLAVMILLLLFFVAGGGVSYSDRWRIDRIDIVGAKAVSTEEIHALVKEKLLGNYFFAYARENSFLFPREEIERVLLDTFPRLKTVSVGRIGAHTIVVTVSERKPYALWCGETRKNAELTRTDAERIRGDVEERGKGIDIECRFIDDTGFVFDRAPVFSEGVYLAVYGAVVGGKVGDPLRGTLPVSRFASANTFTKLIRAELGEPIRVEMKEEGESEIVIRTSATYPFLAGVAVRFKDGENSMTLMNNLRAAIIAQFPENIGPKKKLLYIDMRFGNKIFFGFE